MSTVRRIDAAAVVLLGLCAACLLARLAVVPAMSLDEAWIGLFVGRLRSQGFYTPHEMNHYTGALFAWLAGLFFSWRATSLESLRLPGALLGTAALAGLWLHLRRRVSPEAGAAWLLLAAGSAYFLMKSRLGWEVYALHPILILGVFVALARPGGGPALAALSVLGTQNHFIFLSIPASLVVLFGARASWRGEKEAGPRLRDAAAALAACVVFAAIKHPIDESAWMAHRAALATSLLAGPLLAAVAVRALPIELLLRPFARARRELSVLLALALIAFGVWHVPPLTQIFAGPVVLKRLFAYETPAILSVLLHAWGVFLIGTLAWHCVGAWHDQKLGFHERTIRLWPAAYAAVFVAFRHTSSLRYYSLPFLLSAAALAAVLPRLAPSDKRGLYLCATAAALLIQGLLWRELIAPGDRRPQSFHVGWRRENSRDFARKEALFAAFDSSGACAIAHAQRSFTAIPLFFHREEVPASPCDPALAFDADQHPDSAAPPFYRWAVVPLAK
jgi:hypothetical protein